MDEPKELYTVKEFCNSVRISLRHYHRLRSDGDGPKVTILGGRHLITHSEKLRWLAAHEEGRWFSV